MKQNPILVTGIHRSGSTFVGKMLSLNKKVAYIQEPFNRYYGLEIMGARFKYLKEGSVSNDFKKELDDVVHLKRARYNITSHTEEEKVIVTRSELWTEMLQNINLSNAHKYIGKLLFRTDNQLKFNLAKLDPRIDRVLLKDPEAAFASQFLHRRYDMDVVVLVRHPLSFAGSLKRLGWRFDFDNFLRQRQLMNDYLEPYREELIHLKSRQTTVVEEAAMLWNCIYTVLADFIDKNSSFIVYKHEQIARHPLRSFKDLYEKLGLNFTAGIEQKIRELTSADNPVEAANNRAHQFNRDSAALIHKWKDILTTKEIDYITRKTEKATAMFYDSDVFQ